MLWAARMKSISFSSALEKKDVFQWPTSSLPPPKGVFWESLVCYQLRIASRVGAALLGLYIMWCFMWWCNHPPSNPVCLCVFLCCWVRGGTKMIPCSSCPVCREQRITLEAQQSFSEPTVSKGLFDWWPLYVTNICAHIHTHSHTDTLLFLPSIHCPLLSLIL